MLHVVIALKYFTLVRNVISVRVEVINFTFVMVDSFCNYEMNTV